MRKVAKLLGRIRRSEVDGPVSVLQRAMSQEGATSISDLVDALEATVQHRLWKNHGRPFESFAEFVVALAPVGLGVRTIKPLKLLRKLLLDAGYYSEWVYLLERTLRVKGRARTNLANGEDFQRFYPYPKTQTGRDWMLLKLKQGYPEHFATLCESKGSIRQAAIKAGVVVAARRNSLRFGGCDAEAIKKLPAVDKPKLLREMFRDVGLDAQCTFIKGLEPILGPDLARQWRAQHAQERQPGSRA
jgi:hypothetical protein